MAMQQYLQPTLPPVKPVHRPNILRNSPASSKSSSGFTEQEKLTAHTLDDTLSFLTLFGVSKSNSNDLLDKDLD
jgi:hypothetical protein